MESNMGSKIGYIDIIKDKNYCLYLIGNLISRFGDSIDTIAYGWMVYEITGSTALMAMLFGINALPNIIFQPIAGVYVDYRSKKKILIICNIGRAVVVTITALMFLFGWLRTYHLFIFTFINSSFESFNCPAGVAAYPLIIPKEKYAYATALQSTLGRIVELIGLAVAAAIISMIGIEGGMMINAASFYICALFLSFVMFKEETLNKKAIQLKSYLVDLKEGFLYLKTKKLLFNIAIFGAIFNILLIPFNTLSVAYVKENLMIGVQGVSVMNVSITIGMILGGALFPKIVEKVKGIVIFILAGVVIGLSYLSLYFIPMFGGASVAIYIGLAVSGLAIGIPASIFIMLIGVTFMSKVDQSILGRVAGINNSLVMAATPIGSFVVASLCTFLSTPNLFLIFGIIIIVLFLGQMYNKALREI